MLNLDEAEKSVRTFQKLLDQTPPEACHARISPEAWTLAEITGHLIDSAGNNHQRFVRLRFGNLEHFPGYDAEPWVAAQEYDKCDFTTLSALWASYNALLLHLANNIPADAAKNTWKTPDGEHALEFLVEDYYAHLNLHITHYGERLDEVLAAIAE